MEKRAVLLVDDDEILLKTLEKGIADEPYDKYFAKSGEDALEILKREEVHVIVVDIIMPGIGGIELLKIVKKEYPKIVSMVISGYAQSADAMMVLSDLGVYKFIAKSWTFDENVRMEIRQALDHYNLQSEHEDMPAELEDCSTKTK
jgi:two-component system response regulator HupR/HoxA